MSARMRMQSFLALRCTASEMTHIVSGGALNSTHSRTPLRIKKALGILRELIPTRTTTRVAFCDPPSGSKKSLYVEFEGVYIFVFLNAFIVQVCRDL